MSEEFKSFDGHLYHLKIIGSYKGYGIAVINWKAKNGMDVATAKSNMMVLEKMGSGIAFYCKNQRSQHQSREECLKWIDEQELKVQK